MKRNLCVLVLFFAALASAFAWGGLGHEIVATTAWERLTPDAKQKIERIARANPAIYGNRIGLQILLHAAKWPDEIRLLYRDDDPERHEDIPLTLFKPAVTAASGADDFHYDNRNQAGKRIDNGGVRASRGIQRSVQVLQSATSSARSRGEALAFLTHCVGDLHQPLHAGYRADLGGNSIKRVKLPGREKSWSLHSVWDGGLLAPIPTARSYYESRLKARVDEFTTALNNMDPDVWSEDSYKLAVRHAYRDETGGVIDDDARLSTQYVDAGRKVVEEQLLKAGIRLAALLERSFSNAPAAPTTPATVAANVDWSVHIVIFAAGQADAIAMVTRNGDACIIDAGRGTTTAGHVARFLREKNENGVGRIDNVELAFVTHYDSDHVGGFAALVENGINVRSVVDQGPSKKRENAPVYEGYLNAVGDERNTGRSGIRKRAEPGKQWRLGPMMIECVAVRGDTAGLAHDIDLDPSSRDLDENPGSIALLITHGEFEFYTAGDQTSGDWVGKPDTEMSVVNSGALGRGGPDIDVLKVNHHGSDTSTGATFARALRPELAIISSDFNAAHRLPKMVSVMQLVSNGATVLVTGDGHDPDTRTFADSRNTAVDDEFVPPPAKVFNDAGTVHIYVSPDGSSYRVKADQFEQTFSAIDADNRHTSVSPLQSDRGQMATTGVPVR